MIRNKNVFQKIALSTLLLSAVASPSAFAADVPEETAAASPVTRLTAASAPLLDPVKLAETYAPETVDDWKQTMEQYKEAVSSRIRTVTGGSATITLRAVKTGQALGPSGETATVAAGELTPAPLADNTLPESVEAVAAIPAGEFTPVEGGTPVVVQTIALSELPADVTFTEAKVGQFLTISDETTAAGTEIDGTPFEPVKSGEAKLIALPVSLLLQNGSKLSEAVQSQDAQAIRLALAEQLSQFKERIAKLNALPSGDQTESGFQTVPTTPAESNEG